VVALLGFSAFCLADPVLMAQRYGTHSRHPPSSAPASRQEEAQGGRHEVIDRSQLERFQPLNLGQEFVCSVSS
jgi:hypothetical protein